MEPPLEVTEAPPAAVSAEEAERQAVEDQLNKMKDSSNGPEQVDRRIRELDKMIAGMKKSRKTSAEAVEADSEMLAELDAEISKIDGRYQKLVHSAADRKRRYLALKKLHLAQFDSLTKLTLGSKVGSKGSRGRKEENSVRATLTRASRLGSRMQSKEATEALYKARHRSKMQGRKVSGASMRLTTGAKARRRKKTDLSQEQTDLLATVCAANGVKTKPGTFRT